MNPFTVGFTGHRDARADETELREWLIDHTYADRLIHGGAAGFDSQVDALARSLTTDPPDPRPLFRPEKIVILRPDYGRFAPTLAPKRRNLLIVAQCDLLVALWDGRTTGGTYQTVQVARMTGVPVHRLRPVATASSREVL